MNNPHSLVASLADLCLPSVFNPYRDRCPIHDQPGAPLVRQRNLIRFLEGAIARRVDTLWIARDLGYRGGRRTGLPLTDEVHFGQARALVDSLALGRATRGPIVAERTSAVIWRTLSHIGEPTVLWNIFPLHPHEVGNPLSNRCHSRDEREAAWPLLLAVIDMIRPTRVVAIGRDAGSALSELQLPLHVVRHPSYGGQTEFVTGVQAIYGLVESRSYKRTDSLPFPTAQMLPGLTAA